MKTYFLLFFAILAQVSFAQTSVYIKGSGFNNHSARKLILNGVDKNLPSGRGLCLTIIDASTHDYISSEVYDTYGSALASNNLAEDLNTLNRNQFGILTSYDSWENYVTDDLIAAARRLGLMKLASDKFNQSNRHPYAAIFKGSSITSSNLPNYQAYEIMQSSGSDSDYALIATWLINDTFIGNDLSNTIISTDPNNLDPALIVDAENNIGLGTLSPDEKLTVKGTIHTEEVKVDLQGALVPDYVFETEYDLKSIAFIKEYIRKYKHLPNIPSAQEIEEDGLNLKEMNLILLEKIEELMLYTIEQNERIEILENKVK